MNDEYLEEKPGLGNSFLLTVISHQRFLRKLSNLSRACPKRAPAVGDPTFLSPIHVTHPLSHQPITMPSSPVLPRSHPPAPVPSCLPLLQRPARTSMKKTHTGLHRRGQCPTLSLARTQLSSTPLPPASAFGPVPRWHRPAFPRTDRPVPLVSFAGLHSEYRSTSPMPC